MKIFDIALKDLVRSFRSLFAIGMMLVAPLVITGLISFAFGGASSGSADLPELKVGIVNLDNPPAGLPPLGSALSDMFKAPSVSTWIKPSPMADEASARAAVEGRQIGLAVIIPANFTQSAIAGTGSASITLVQDPTLTIGPTVVKNMIDSLLDEVSGSLTAAQIAIQHKAVPDAPATQAVISQFQTWFTGFQNKLYASPDSALAFKTPAANAQAAGSTQNLMGSIMAGMMVFFAFYTGAYSMMSILKEDEEGTLARLFSTPTSRTTILAGKFLAVFLMVFVQSLVLMAAGVLIFKINWGVPFSAALVVAGQVASASGLGVLLISFVKTARQAGPLLGGALSALGMLGGLFTSGIQMPAAFELAGKVTPQGWVMAGWRLALTGSPVVDLLLPFAIMLVIGIVTFVIGGAHFQPPLRLILKFVLGVCAMRMLDLALKDLSQILRDRRSLLFLLAMPIVFTFFMGFASGGAAQTSANQDPRLAVAWLNKDAGSLASEQLKSLLQASDGIRLEEKTQADAAGLDDSVKSGKYAAAVVVPQGFSAQALAGQPAQVDLVADQMTATGQSAFQLVRAPVTRLMGAIEIARLDVQALEAESPFGSAAGRQSELEKAFTDAVAGWQTTASQGARVVIEKATGQAAQGQPFGGNPYNQMSPGMLVQFAIFGLVSSATILVQERKTRTLQRMITTSMTSGQIIAGHTLANFSIVLGQEILLILFGQLALKVNYLRDPLAVLVVAVGVAVCVASMGLLLSSVAKSEEQVTLFSLIAMFVLTGLGGAWFPLESTGAAFSTIGHLTPTAWAMDGFQNILLRGQGLGSVLLPAGLLLVYAAAFFAIAVWRFKLE